VARKTAVVTSLNLNFYTRRTRASFLHAAWLRCGCLQVCKLSCIFFTQGSALASGQGSDCKDLFSTSREDLARNISSTKRAYTEAEAAVHNHSLMKRAKHHQEKQLRSMKQDPYPYTKAKTGNSHKVEPSALPSGKKLLQAVVIDLCTHPASQFDHQVKRLSEKEFQRLTISKTLVPTLQSCRVVVVDATAEICYGSCSRFGLIIHNCSTHIKLQFI
jgi:hypothetical protein